MPPHVDDHIVGVEPACGNRPSCRLVRVRDCSSSPSLPAGGPRSAGAMSTLRMGAVSPIEQRLTMRRHIRERKPQGRETRWARGPPFQQAATTAAGHSACPLRCRNGPGSDTHPPRRVAPRGQGWERSAPVGSPLSLRSPVRERRRRQSPRRNFVSLVLLAFSRRICRSRVRILVPCPRLVGSHKKHITR